MSGSKAWLDARTGRIYISPLFLDKNKEYVEVILKPGPWEGLVEVVQPDGDSFVVGSHELIG